MKKNKKIVMGYSIVSVVCFGSVSYGYFYRGQVERGWVFAILTIAQLILALIYYFVSKKNK